MLSAAESTGIERVIALRPPLLAMYAVSPRLARSPWRDEMLTIAPCPAARMHGIAARQSHIGAVRLTRRIASHAGVARSATAPSSPVPAALSVSYTHLRA